MKQRRRDNPEAFARYHRRCNVRREYGIELEDFEAIIEAQNGVCVICEGVPKYFVVDHDHETGLVRGALCHQCNLKMAALDSPLFDRLLAYKKGQL